MILSRDIVIVYLFLFLSACATNMMTIEYEDPFADYEGKMIKIRGSVSKPQGNGPFPAVVLQHGCDGIGKRVRNWASVLNGWGYATAIVDSNGPRYVYNGCGKTGGVAIDARGYDAYAAKSFIGSLPYIDPNRIGIMGFSQGARSVLCAINEKCISDYSGTPFKTAIAFYPLCVGSLKDNNAPLLVLIGEKDDWTPASMCHHMSKLPRGRHEAHFVFYPNATHSFDVQGNNHYYMGHYLKYSPEATRDARIQVKNFLSEYLK